MTSPDIASSSLSRHSYAQAVSPHRLLPLSLICALALACTACATSSSPGSAGPALTVRAADEHSLWHAPATYTVQSVSSGAANRVVGLPGLGEIDVDGDAARCRFVWSKAGLDQLVILSSSSPSPCASVDNGRVCFKDAHFASDRAGDSVVGVPRALVVDGCADENTLLWSRTDGAQPASVGPTAFRARCAKVPKQRGCDITYLKRRAVHVDSNDAPDQGFSFAWDGDAWRACFLEKEAGRYRLDVDVEDSCHNAKTLTLAGTSTELDD